MFVPPFQLLLEELRPAPSGPRPADDVVMPRVLLELMLRLLVEQMPFDAEDYLDRNPDVREAVAEGKLESAHQHFVQKGYFEGRAGGAPTVDAEWYQHRYGDVAAALKAGKIESVHDHYTSNGVREWRSPSEAEETLVNEWRSALATAAANAAIPPVPLPAAYLKALKRQS
ncbi:MAG: hypothetical protein ABS99_05505 [Acetobacteraceae bacterium SCN 69-10]|nr:hypothetical protein [Rhodospirillales bacterium]ODU56807.1 MAG: hypothetical protein ABS99_05505 [Acetobacteraceae bacterium SCN 69-10]OJY66778.1 MAG: hypothetical protein BGP12_10895 [Rhodospirillales bacterium 70-18]